MINKSGQIEMIGLFYRLLYEYCQEEVLYNAQTCECKISSFWNNIYQFARHKPLIQIVQK